MPDSMVRSAQLVVDLVNLGDRVTQLPVRSLGALRGVTDRSSVSSTVPCNDASRPRPNAAFRVFKGRGLGASSFREGFPQHNLYTTVGTL